MVGDAHFGRYMLGEMERAGIETDQCLVQADAPTDATVVLSRGEDRATLTSTKLMTSLRIADVPATLLKASRHLHVASYFLQSGLAPQLPELFGTARDLGLTTSVDFNWDPSEAWQADIEALGKVTDIFFLNGEELRHIAGEPDVATAVGVLINRAGATNSVVIVKLGAQGALAAAPCVSCRASPPKVRLVDTTGAGDSFDAGFVHGLLAGWRIDESLRLAVVCGTLSTRATGGTAAQPNLAEATRVLDGMSEGASATTRVPA
jgi:sugar/nucleoside kinase (ribokinase family)